MSQPRAEPSSRATARSAFSSFARPTPTSRRLPPAPGVEAVASTTGLGSLLEEEETLATVESDVQQATGNPAGEPLFGLQWNMTQIDVPEAHAVTTGSPDVVVGVLDSGISSTHPDLVTQIAKDKSASCLGGVVDTTEAAWNPTTSGPRHACRRHRRRRAQRRRRHRRGPGREGCVGEGRHGRRLHLSRGGGVRIHVGRRARDAGHEQQLLHRPLGAQLPQRRAPASGVAGRTACDQVLAEQGRAQQSHLRATRTTTCSTSSSTPAARTTAARRSRRAR